jgi:hypothetical protein
MNDVTQILSAIEQGDTRAADQLFPLVYEALRKLAAAKLAEEAPGQTLQATALVHEAYLKLVETQAQQWNSRCHFFAAAAEAMRPPVTRTVPLQTEKGSQTEKEGRESLFFLSGPLWCGRPSACDVARQINKTPDRFSAPHALLGCDDPSKISAAAITVMQDPANDRLLSAATVWELAIKFGQGKITLSMPYRQWVEKGIADLKLRHFNSWSASRLPPRRNP